MKKTVFEVSNLRKEIEGNVILQNVSFKLEENISIAIRGQNGSGKSTLLKLLAGIYEPTSGKIRRNARRIGYVPEHFPESIRFNLKEYLMLIASFHGISKLKIESELLEYINLFGIESFMDTPLKQCSKGTKQKVGLLQALIIKPDILLLDEPLTGLDSTSQQSLLTLLEKLKKQMTIIFTSHEDLLVDCIADQTLYVEDRNISFHNETTNKNRVIKVKFPNKDIFTELDFIDINYDGDTAMLTVSLDYSDVLLKKLLNKNCSVLEVRERK
ncbi:ATP-binding cassette domain-containing protein [Psychrobacillus sp. NPDC058041]|uniref:ATP-binding cassette domain-containing protein n=1 Tax=Psychrobacillus sp. NPDC058041 TaxID=3346310 RepID=UPI0036DAA911